MRHTIRSAASLLLALLPVAAMRAQDIVVPAVGTSTSGTPFDQRAATGEHLGAVSIYAGGFVEGLRLQFRDRWGANTAQSPLLGAANVAVATFTPTGVAFLERVDVWVESGLVNKVALQTSTGQRQTFGSTRAGEVLSVFQAGSGREIIGLHGSASATVYSLGITTRPLLATAQIFGNPCQTSLGPVTMRYRLGAEFLRLGSTTIVEVTNVPTNHGALLITAGFSRTLAGGIPLPFALDSLGAPGCTVWASNDCTILTSREPNGTAGWSLTVPNSAALAGIAMHFQGYVFGPWNAAGLAASNGLTGMVGSL